MTQPPPIASRDDFDFVALFDAIDQRRTASGLSWQRVADAVWEQSAVLNRQRADHPISPATLSGMKARRQTSCQHALAFLRWLGRTPESFVPASAGGSTNIPLPQAGPDRRLRWDFTPSIRRSTPPEENALSRGLLARSNCDARRRSSRVCGPRALPPGCSSRCASCAGSTARPPTSSALRGGDVRIDAVASTGTGSARFIERFSTADREGTNSATACHSERSEDSLRHRA